MGVASVFAVSGVSVASTGGPTPAVAATIVLTPSDVAGVLHERVVLPHEKAITTPTRVFGPSCVGFDIDGIGAASANDATSNSEQTFIDSLVVIRSSRATVAHDVRLFRTRAFALCNVNVPNPQVSALRLSLGGTSATVGWRVRSGAHGFAGVADLWVFAVDREEVLLSTLGSELPATAAPRFLAILLKRTLEHPH